jgi:hypothetical protein
MILLIPKRENRKGPCQTQNIDAQTNQLMKTIPRHNPTSKAQRIRPLIGWIGCLAVFFASINPSKGATVSIGVDHWAIDGTGVGGAVMPLPSTTDLVNAGSPDLLYFNSTSFI